jgi:glucose/arabinose dehydrogenase
VLRLKLDPKGNILSHEDFITGWLRKSGKPDGRPVDIEQSSEGDLYLSDDYLRVVYLITNNNSIIFKY